MKDKLIYALTLGFLLLLLPFISNAQCSISPSNTSITVGQTKTFTANSGAQAYFWTVSGPGTIVGSNTNQSVSVRGTASGTIQLCANRFSGGGCQTCCTSISCTSSCDVTINQYIPMCYSQFSNCYQRRGDFEAKDCNGNNVTVDWDISPNGCINNGCNNPVSGRITSSWVKPHPTCDWRGLNVTLRIYTPGTNNLLDSRTTQILDCDAWKGAPKKVGQTEELDAAPIELLNNQPGGDKRISLNLSSAISYSVEAMNISSGKTFIIQEETQSIEGTTIVDFPEDKLPKGAVYLILLKSGNELIGSAKLLNM